MPAPSTNVYVSSTVGDITVAPSPTAGNVLLSGIVTYVMNNGEVYWVPATLDELETTLPVDVQVALIAKADTDTGFVPA